MNKRRHSARPTALDLTRQRIDAMGSGAVRARDKDTRIYGIRDKSRSD
jgi:hypothetical protein